VDLLARYVVEYEITHRGCLPDLEQYSKPLVVIDWDLNISDEKKSLILGGNAARLFEIGGGDAGYGSGRSV
jgi:hypothetical protein